MALTYTFKAPITIGTYPNQVSVGSARLSSVAFNFQGTAPAAAQVYVTLQDPISGAQVAAVGSSDAAGLALVRAMLAATNPATGHTFEADLIARAVAATDPVSGKTMVPAGTAA